MTPSRDLYNWFIIGIQHSLEVNLVFLFFTVAFSFSCTTSSSPLKWGFLTKFNSFRHIYVYLVTRASFTIDPTTPWVQNLSIVTSKCQGMKPSCSYKWDSFSCKELYLFRIRYIFVVSMTTLTFVEGWGSTSPRPENTIVL